jgi:hypothetical protein
MHILFDRSDRKPDKTNSETNLGKNSKKQENF